MKNRQSWNKKLNKKNDRLTVFREIPVNQQGFVLLDIPRKLREEIVEHLSNEELSKLVNYLDPDEASDLLKTIKKSRIETILSELGKNIQSKVEHLLKFDNRTAANIMSFDYIEIDKNDTIEKASQLIRKHEKRTGKIPTLLVVENGFLLGELSLHRFAIAKKREKIHKHTKKVPCVKYDQKERDIVDIFKKHPHGKIIVLDENESILGVIYSDDILRIIENQTAKTLRDFAGIREEEDVLDGALVKVKYRYKWLIINLGTAFLAAAVVGLFEETISRLVLLAAYLPIVAGMGGNAATQTLAVTVRGLALKEIELGTGKRVVINEMIAGVINGVITGTIAAFIAVFWNQSPMLGVVIGLAMVTNLLIAGLFGTIMPLIMQKLDKDPASSATIFITTATDVFGFLTFLGLAKALM